MSSFNPNGDLPYSEGGERTEADLFWEKMADCGRQEISVSGRLLRRGGRVRLMPHPGGDMLDRVLAGRMAVIEGIDEDDGGGVHVCVTLEDDPGRDLAATRHPARRFFFTPEEVEPLDDDEEAKTRPRVLVAGIGNIFFGDDGFGVAVAQRLLEGPLPAGVEVADFGIRGLDLAYALGRPYDAAILVDALPRGRSPGALCLLVPDEEGAESADLDAHGMNPLAVLGMARRMGDLPPRVFIVGCEPGTVGGEDHPEGMSMRLSAPVAAAVDEAAKMVLETVGRLLAGENLQEENG